MSQDTPPASPLRFHPHHGDDLRLANNYTTAQRTAVGSGLVFTSHPLKPYQKLSFKLSKISDQTKDIVSVGFSTQHPTQTHEPIYNLKIVSLKNHKRLKNKNVHFFYTPSGKIHFGVDGKEKGCRGGLTPTQESLWAFIHISSPPTTIEVVNSTFYLSNQGLVPMTLHQTRGRNVKLVKNQVSKYDRRLTTSYAFTANPIKAGEHVVVKILDIDCRSTGGLIVGLTSSNPSLLEKDLPDDVGSFLTRSGYWIVVSDPSWSFKMSDTITFVITRDGKMKIWRNESTLLKEIRVNVDSQLWAFFDIAALESVEIMSYTPVDFGNFDLFEPDWKEVKNEVVISVKKEVDGEDDGSLCAICYENVIEAALYPCGHMCLCYGCAREQWRGSGRGSCPMCRVKIRDILKIYKV
ncbi:protein neuralized-like [Zophobas morio]|uniref:protein neuralized-like n=1 Tax=Zophobas morio TaxID=2755281 RepID=UPI0030836E85